MDPLSITASITTVLQLTSKAIKYLVDTQNAPLECQSCTVELSNLLPSLISLKDRASRAHDKDPWFEQLRHLNAQNGSLDQYKQTLELLLSRVSVADGLNKVKKRLLWSFNKDQIASIQEKIERFRSLITIALLMDHMALSEAIKAETSCVRASLLHVQADISALQANTYTIKHHTVNISDAQNRQHHREVLNWLSSSDYHAQLQHVLSRRQEGTAQWFLDSKEFTQWMQGSEKTLLCTGIPGVGKTMMAAVSIDYLNGMYDADKAGIAYIFCSYQAQVHQEVINLLAAILKQLAPKSADAMESLTQLYDKYLRRGGRPSLDELFDITLQSVSQSTVYIIIDALDECSNGAGARDRLIETLFSVQAKSNARLLFTSRFVPEVTDKFRLHSKLEVRASEEDVRRFICGQQSRLPNCVLRNEELRRDVQEVITAAADGMFLLARLHFDSICEQTTLREVRTTLARLSTGSDALDIAYEDALSRIDRQPPKHRNLARRALCWISYAQRQLTSHELCTALAIEPGETALDVENLNDLDDLVSFCVGLVTVDQESNIIRLVHHTTQEYLRRVRLTWAPNMQEEVAVACLTYLLFEEFSSGSCESDVTFERRLRQHVFFDYSARFWSQHLRPVERTFAKLAMKVVHDADLRDSIAQVISVSDYRYPGYSGVFPTGFTALHLVAYFGSHFLLQRLLECENDSHRNIIDKVDRTLRTPLHYAARNGHEPVVKLLLEQAVDFNARDGHYENALQMASKGGHEQVVKLLLEQGASVNAQTGYYGRALQAASAYGHEQIVRLLLDSGAHINAQGGEFGNALVAASLRGHKQVVNLLLEQGANVNARSEDYGSALLTASLRGHEKVVRLLLEQEANVNAQDRYYGSALQVASAYGHEQVVRLLFDSGAHINASRGVYGTALAAATKGGYEQIVKLLREHGAR